MPYREEEPLESYALKSSGAFTVVLVLVSLLAIAALGLMITAGPGAPLRLYFVGALPLLALLAYAASARSHRVVGGKGELRLFRNRIEVPRAFRGGTMSFDARQTTMRLRAVQGRVALVQVSEVKVLELVSASGSRHLSSRLFESMDAFDQAAEDVGRILAGLEPAPRRDEEDAPPKERDKYDELIDREIAG